MTIISDLITPLQLDSEQLGMLQHIDICQAHDFGNHQKGYRLSPQTAEQVAQLLNLAAHQHQKIALHSETAAYLDYPVWLDISALNQMRRYRVSDLTITVETGMRFDQLQEILAQENHHFPLYYPQDTLLSEILAHDLPALESGRYGYPRDYVLGVEIATPDGRLTKYGGEVVKNVTGYDLNKLYVGSHHQLGVMTAVTLKVTSKPQHEFHGTLNFKNASAVWQWLKDHQPLLNQTQRLEIFSTSPNPQNNWELLLSYHSPYPTLLEQTQSELLAACNTIKELSSTETGDLLAARQTWPRQSLVLEIAHPLGQTQAMFNQLQQAFSNHLPDHIQCRPNAGLLYAIWTDPTRMNPDELEPSLQYVGEKLSAQHDGHLYWAQKPIAWPDIPQTGNTIRHTLQEKIRALYDPQGCLSREANPR